MCARSVLLAGIAAVKASAVEQPMGSQSTLLTYAMTGTLLATAAGVWWWAERHLSYREQ
ncbi:MAG TPA: hypothetical protein VEL51_24945 [Vicinamibacterales bacterium]|nr:hypothetical protein [Vicinamibacterales bacterium]